MKQLHHGNNRISTLLVALILLLGVGANKPAWSADWPYACELELNQQCTSTPVILSAKSNEWFACSTLTSYQAYFSTTLSQISSGDVTPGTYKGWCLDSQGFLGWGENYAVELYPSIGPPSLQNPWDQTSMNRVNYILNHKEGKWFDVQEALWETLLQEPIPYFPAGDSYKRGGTSANNYLGGCTVYGGLTFNESAIDSMRNNASDYGSDYRPGPSGVVAVLAVPIDQYCNPYFGADKPQLSIIEKTCCSGKIGDYIWFDRDRDGFQDPEEDGINGVEVIITDGSRSFPAITTTGGPGNKAGYYEFNGLCAGDYTVKVGVNVPSGYQPTEIGTTAPPATPSSDSNDPAGTLVTLAADNGENLTIDFGYMTPCSAKIGNYVWTDENRNGIQDDSQSDGIAGVGLTLTGAAVDGTVVNMTATTDAAGYYIFPGLCSGTYTVAVDTGIPTDYTVTAINAGSAPENDSDNPGGTVVTLTQDEQADVTIDFGYLPPCDGRIGDFVWHDANRNGIQDDGENTGIQGVGIVLTNSLGETTNTTTNELGFYEFTKLCPDSYSVAVDASTVPAYQPTDISVEGSTTENDSNDGTGTTTVLYWNDNQDPTIDFGYVTPCTGSIGDFVWFDTDQDGIQDAGEVGMNGVGIVLADDQGPLMNATTLNHDGRDGYYQFSGLCAGTYTVSVNGANIPGGYQPTVVHAQGSTPENDSDLSAGTLVTLATDDATDQTIDFGYFKLAPGTGTPGYWKNHPEAWPVSSITIGGNTYTKAQAIAFMKQPDGDKTFTMFRSLVCAKLNVMIGNEGGCITGTITAADAWMATYPVGSAVRAKTTPWKVGEPLYMTLDNYNNGFLCAPHRD